MAYLKYPKFMERRKSFPKHGISTNDTVSTVGKTWFTVLALSTLDHIARVVFPIFTLSVFLVMSRRKPPFDTSMSYFIIQSTLIIFRFYICEFACTLKFIGNP